MEEKINLMQDYKWSWYVKQMPCSKILLSMYLTKLSDSILSKIYPSVIRVYIQLTIFRSKGTGTWKTLEHVPWIVDLLNEQQALLPGRKFSFVDT